MSIQPFVCVFSDFNGTIVEPDMLAALLGAYGHSALLQQVEDGRMRGYVSLRERIAAEARALTCSLAEADALLDTLLSFDESFTSFCERCTWANVSVTLLTSGIEPLVRNMLVRHGIESIPLIANDVDDRRDGWLVRFRDATPEGNAKHPHVERARREGRRTVIVGDGESDFEMARIADVRFAKRASPLDAFLKSVRLPYHAFDTFEDVWERLCWERLLAE